MSVPRIVRDHVERNASGAPVRVRLRQAGEIRLDPAKPWWAFTAEQAMAVDTTAFVWRAQVRMAPLVTGVVEDAFEDGTGRLDARLWRWIRLAHARGPNVDRSEAQRYLAELPWCPWALLRNPDLRFEERDARTVRVSVFDPETWVDLSFDEAGDVIGARTTTRYRATETQPWVGRFSAYRDFDGLRAPAHAEVAWEDDAGEFLYWKADVVALEHGA